MMMRDSAEAPTAAATFERICANLGEVVRGKRQVLEYLVVTLFAGGHCLMEDVPGVGKTTLAKTLARSIRGDFKRVQFTPDLLPTDILGASVYNPKDGKFEFREGPVFTHILLADEINRASPRTQSSLLEAMNERQVTIEGRCYELAAPFLVVATQNPVEYHGTYPLPEAQLDRFATRLELGYPSLDDELDILECQHQGHPLDKLQPVVDLAEILAAQEATRRVRVDRSVAGYVMALVHATREDPRVKLGASTRAALAMYRTAQALALSRGRGYVLPDDVKELAVQVLAHRLLRDTKTKYSGITKETIVQEILHKVKVPT